MNQFKPINYKKLIIQLMIITIIFFMIGNFLIISIENYYYDSKKAEALKVAQTYSQQIIQSQQAYQMIEGLLKDKIEMVNQMIIFDEHQHSNEHLKTLANLLVVDQIYYYDATGEIINSSNGQAIGSNITVGDAAYDFMMGGQQQSIQLFKRKLGADERINYGFYRSPTGEFLKIILNAERVNQYFESFALKTVLSKIKTNEETMGIRFINEDYTIVESTMPATDHKKLNNPQGKMAIQTNAEVGIVRELNGNQIYEVFVPVQLQSSAIGALAIRYPLDETKNLIQTVTNIGVIILILTYGFILYIILSDYETDQKLINIAYFDTLTKLPNNDHFKGFINQQLQQKMLTKKAILLIELTSLRLINMTYGYSIGDVVLQEINERLQQLIEDHQKLFRLSGDKFIIYLNAYDSKDDLIHLSQQINSVLSKPLMINEHQQYLKLKIGIVEMNQSHETVEQLLKEASIIVSSITTTNKINYGFFDQGMETRLHRDEKLANELRTIIDSDNAERKIYLKYQPQIDLKTNKIIGFETLARMRSDYYGEVSPVEFIAIAEQKQLIVPLSNLILKEALTFLKSLNKNGFQALKMAINISGIQLLRDDFTDTVLEIIDHTQTNAAMLELEITESILLDNFTIVNERLNELRTEGIKVSLDDFGTGYSSFSRLGELNVDYLKIDKYFVHKINEKNPNEIIAGDIISMAHKFKIKVIAEGVETLHQNNFLIHQACDLVQGYLFAKPLSENDALVLLKKGLGGDQHES